MVKNAPFSQALKTCFWHTFFQTALIQRPIEIFPLNQLQMATNNPKLSVKESRANLSQSITEIFKPKEWPHLIVLKRSCKCLDGYKRNLVLL